MIKIQDIQIKRGNKEYNDSLVGRSGSFSIDYESRNVRIHDGVTPGGYMSLKNLDNLNDLTGEYLQAEEFLTGLDGVTDYVTNTIDYTRMDRVRVEINNVRVAAADWRVLIFDPDTLNATIRIMALINAGDTIRVSQFLTIQDVVDAVLTDRINELDLDGYVETIEKGAANGVATLDSSGKIPLDQIPRIEEAGYDLSQVLLTSDNIDLGDIDINNPYTGLVDPNIPADAIAIHDSIDCGHPDSD